MFYSPMTNPHNNRIRTAATVVGVTLCFGIVYILLFNLRSVLGYSAVLTDAQNALIVIEPEISDKGLYIDDNQFRESSKYWTLTLGKAKKYLRGVQSLHLTNTIVPIRIEIDLNTKKISNITVGNNGSEFGGDWIDSGGKHCGSKEVIAPHTFFSDIAADVSIGTVHFFPKRIKVSGSISIARSEIPPAPHFMCKDGQVVVNEGDPITLEIRNLQFDIDSEVIYRWSSKGGDTYEI